MTSSSKKPEPENRPGWPLLLGTAGVGMVAVLCCAGPLLVASSLAAGTLAAIGAWAASPWVIAAATILAVVAGWLLFRHITHRRGRPSVDDCCTPGNAGQSSGNRE